jgi:transglutaminase-like putative cysteine protease
VTRSRPLLPVAEVALAAVTLAAVLGMSRLFDGGGWLEPLAANAVAAHGVAALARRRGLSLAGTGAVMAAAATGVTTWTCYWSTTTAGLPTGETWSTMRSDLDRAWTLYQDVVAPAPVETGFVLASAVAIWFVAYVADWAAFRLWVPFEATLPAGTLFLFTALLGTDRGRGWAVGLYSASLLLFLLLHRMARQDATSHWVADRRGEGHRSLLVAGAGLGMAAVLLGTVLGPAVPGASSPGVLDPRSLRDGDQSRVVISPLIDIRSRLVNQRDVEVFTVRSPQPAYWRLTSLGRFDGVKWTSSGSYERASGDLPTSVDEIESETFEQTFSIRSLAAIWLPSAYRPEAFDGQGLEVLYEEESSTLIVDRELDTSDGLVYTVTSSSPRLGAEDLTGAAGPVPDEVQDGYLELPDDFSPAVQRLAAELTSDAATPYEQALALQAHLRTFAYDLSVQPGHSGDVLEQFLFDTRRGYCEQFAGAFAAMARAIGLPARVAVGFTQGVADPADPTTYVVRGENAHAWPEVYLAGVGWVSFEPTPGRGQPFAEAYTGVPAQQAAAGDPATATTAPATTTPVPSDSIPDASSDPRSADDRVDTGIGAPSGETGGGSAPRRFVLDPLRRALPIAGALLLAYLVVLPAGILVRRHLRRRRTVDPAARVSLAWTEAAEAAEIIGYEERRSDTPGERAERLASCLPDDRDAREQARNLARRAEIATYSAGGADELDAELAEEARTALVTAVRTAASRWARIRPWVDARPWLRRWRREQRTEHRRITTTAPEDRELQRL